MAEGDSPEVLVTVDEATAVVTLNRPRVHNALNRAVLSSLAEVFADLEGRSEVRAIVLTGAGEKSFCAGADLAELAGLDAGAALDTLRFGQSVMAGIARCRVPVISAVNGLALGGGFELVLSTTFPVLSERAALALPESGLGLIPGYGGTQRLPLGVGRQVAAHLMLTSQRLGAERAYQLGLTPIAPVAPDELLSVAREIAADIAGRGPNAVGHILAALQTGAPRAEHLDFEAALAGVATSSAEAAEGIDAFNERRRPRFADRTVGGTR